MADQIAGYTGYVEYLAESTYGTIPTFGTFQWFGHVTRATPKSSVDIHELHRLRAAGATTNNRDADELNPTLEHHSIAVDFLAQTGIVDVLELGLGATGAPADSLTSVTILAVALSGTAEMRANGCVCNTFEVSCEAGGEVEVNVDFTAQDIVETSTLGLDFTSDITGVDAYAHATEVTSPVLDFANCEVSLSGTTLTLCTGFSFKVDNKLEERHRMFGSTPENVGEVVQKTVSLTGQITIDFQDVAEYDTLLARAGVTIAIKVGAKTWTFASCKLGNLEVPISPEDLIGLSVPFTAKTLTIA